MLTLFGPRHRDCDGLSRRSFLEIGGPAMGGLGHPDVLCAESRAGLGTGAGTGLGPGRRHKSVIMAYPSGGLSHQDTSDIKPEAPEEIRGESGRTPKINEVAGRDHRARAPINGAPPAVGGMRVGQVIGTTDRPGGSAASHPIHTMTSWRRSITTWGSIPTPSSRTSPGGRP